MLQIYGCFEGWLSHAQVGRGIVAGLLQNGVDLCIWNVAPVGSGYSGYTGFEDFGVEPLVDLVPDAESALYIGGYPPFAIPWMTYHRHKHGLFITESARVPREWGACLAGYRRVFFPSSWALEAYCTTAGVPPQRARVCHHGLHPVFGDRPLKRKLPNDRLHLLHVAGAASFLPRKGTDVLLRAFAQAFNPGEAQLTLRTPDTPGVRSLIADLPAPVQAFVAIDFTADTWQGLPPPTVRELYSAHHAVVQPSRAEAFGMVPLEARAMERCVVMTTTTGHAEHFEPSWDVIVTTSTDDRPIAVNGIPEGLAPEVDEDGLVTALRLLYERWRAAPKVGLLPERYYENWSWQAVTAQMADELSGEKGRRKL